MKLKKEISMLLIVSSLLTASGCSINKNNDDGNITINIKNEDRKIDEYSYILNLNCLENIDINKKNKIDLLKLTSGIIYTSNTSKAKQSNIYEKVNTAFLLNTIFKNMVLPSCYNHYLSKNEKVINLELLNPTNSELEVDYKFYITTNDVPVTIIKTLVRINEDIIKDNLKIGDKCFKKGDVLEAVSIIYDGVLVGFKQTGIGSYCKNITNIGNVENCIIDLDNVYDKDINIKYKDKDKILEECYRKIYY